MLHSRFSLAVMLHISIIAFCQDGIGIGTLTPDASAILDVQPPAKNRGLLIPRLTSAERNAIASPAEGLLVFDTDLKKFCYYNLGWYTLNELTEVAGSQNITHTGNVSVSGTISATDYALNASGNGPVPRGGIIMWSGLVSRIPAGWALCDGTNGTPDLRGKFTVGYYAQSADYATIGNTGGIEKQILKEDEIPRVYYTLNYYTIKAAENSAGDDVVGLGPGRSGTGVQSSSATMLTRTNELTSPTGQPAPHENRPPYFVVAYIMKL